MIFKEAMRSLKHDKSRAFFYWLTLMLTTTFMYLYFNIAMDESIGMSLGESSDNIITIITLISVLICCADIFFANDYYVKNKSKDLAVRLVSGATYVHIAGYLLIQTSLLMLLAIPSGILIARFLMTPLNMIVSSVLPGGTHIIEPVPRGELYTYVILAFIVCWIVVMNLSFTYLNSAASLINQRNASKGEKGSMFYLKSIPNWMRQIFWLFMFLAPVYTFYANRDSIVLFACIGMVGFNGILRWIIRPFITRMISAGKSEPKRIAYFGFIREDLQVMKFAMYLLLVSVIIMASILVTNQSNPMVKVMITMSYIFLSVLQAMALMFRYSTELSERKRHFASLSRIGYTMKQLKSITRKEVFGYYGSVLLISMIYLINIYISLVSAGTMNTSFAIALVLIVAIPLCICAIGSLFYYRGIVLTEGAQS